MHGHLLTPVHPVAVADGRHLCSWLRTRYPEEDRGRMPAQLLWAAWRQAAGCTHVARERPGVSGPPVSTLLEGLFTRRVVQAPHITAVPGRQTAVKEAEWLAERLRPGLCRGSCMPSKPQRQLRERTRPRTTFVQDRARGLNRRPAV
jgi:hypothetical protein